MIPNAVATSAIIWTRIAFIGKVEVCMGPGPAQARQIRGDFSNRPGWHMRGDFSNEPGWVDTWEVIFRTGRARPAKREMSFLKTECGYKSLIKNLFSQQ